MSVTPSLKDHLIKFLCISARWEAVARVLGKSPSEVRSHFSESTAAIRYAEHVVEDLCARCDFTEIKSILDGCHFSGFVKTHMTQPTALNSEETYVKLKLTLNNHLMQQEWKRMGLVGQIPAGVLGGMKSAMEMFAYLEGVGTLSRTDVAKLKFLLCSVPRLDLVRDYLDPYEMGNLTTSNSVPRSWTPDVLPPARTIWETVMQPEFIPYQAKAFKEALVQMLLACQLSGGGIAPLIKAFLSLRNGRFQTMNLIDSMDPQLLSILCSGHEAFAPLIIVIFAHVLRHLPQHALHLQIKNFLQPDIVARWEDDRSGSLSRMASQYQQLLDALANDSANWAVLIPDQPFNDELLCSYLEEVRLPERAAFPASWSKVLPSESAAKFEDKSRQGVTYLLPFLFNPTTSKLKISQFIEAAHPIWVKSRPPDHYPVPASILKLNLQLVIHDLQPRTLPSPVTYSSTTSHANTFDLLADMSTMANRSTEFKEKLRKTLEDNCIDEPATFKDCYEQGDITAQSIGMGDQQVLFKQIIRHLSGKLRFKIREISNSSMDSMSCQ